MKIDALADPSVTRRPWAGPTNPPRRSSPRVADLPRLLVIERDARSHPEAREALGKIFDVTVARSMARALVTIRQQPFVGVYVDAAQLASVRWAGLLLQADEILDAIADGVAVVDTDLKILWANPEFGEYVDPSIVPVDATF